jgi:hypothetical protein
MTSLLKEFSGVPIGAARPDLKNSDGSDAGKNDINQKVSKNDVSFSLMRNTINSDGEVTGSDVANYLERAHELNDEVDTVPFGLQTSDGDIVKVYVNAEQADQFEEKMKQLLGVEDDIEEAVNKLAQEFDIVDVVWPQNKDDQAAEPELNLDSEEEFDALDDGTEEPMNVVAEYDPLEEGITDANYKNQPEFKVTYRVYGSNKDVPLYTKTRKVFADSEDDARKAAQKMLGGQIMKIERVSEESLMADLEALLESDKAPTKDESVAYKKLVAVVKNLESLGTAGVRAQTGAAENLTKIEMIQKYIAAKYSSEGAKVSEYLTRIGAQNFAPYWVPKGTK